MSFSSFHILSSVSSAFSLFACLSVFFVLCRFLTSNAFLFHLLCFTFRSFSSYSSSCLISSFSSCYRCVPSIHSLVISPPPVHLFCFPSCSIPSMFASSGFFLSLFHSIRSLSKVMLFLCSCFHCPLLVATVPA